jgi:hypothetical protein
MVFMAAGAPRTASFVDIVVMGRSTMKRERSVSVLGGIPFLSLTVSRYSPETMSRSELISM